MLNRLTLLLAPVALASVLLYSFTKRWTLLSHVVLGWCLAIAPTGAWIAVRGEIGSLVPLLLSLVVLLWTAGFDVLTHVRITNLIGAKDCSLFLRESHWTRIANSTSAPRRSVHGAGLAISCDKARSNRPARCRCTGVLLLYQHRLVRADDLGRLNAAFFTTNAFVSVILLLTFVAQPFCTTRSSL